MFRLIALRNRLADALDRLIEVARAGSASTEFAAVRLDLAPSLCRKLDRGQRGGRKFVGTLRRSTLPSSRVRSSASRVQAGIVADDQQPSGHRPCMPRDQIEQVVRPRPDRFARRNGRRAARHSPLPARRASRRTRCGRARRARRSNLSAAPLQLARRSHRAAFRPRAFSGRSKSSATGSSQLDLAWRRMVSASLILLGSARSAAESGIARRLASRFARLPPEDSAPRRARSPDRAAPGGPARPAGRPTAAATASPPTGSRTAAIALSRRISRPNAWASRARTTRSS